MLFCLWKRGGDFCEDNATDPSVFDGLVLSFEHVYSPDYLTDNFVRRCKLKGIRQFHALLCNTERQANISTHDPTRSSFDISPDAIVDFLSGSEGDEQVVVFRLGWFCYPISVLQRLILAFDQGHIPQRFQVSFSGQYRQVRLAMREWYATCFVKEQPSAHGPMDTYHIPSVDFMVYVLDICILIQRHMDMTKNELTFESRFDY
ncbi:hypothetical protein AAVH_23770 [Aphelenchoides avenae]|nr:hypothetical protein AAVH_23770 [Aphelenchus avenae]